MAGGLRVWNAGNLDEAKQWERCWGRWPEREVFGHPGYLRLFASPTAQPLCAAWEAEQGGVLFAFLARDLSVEPFCPPHLGTACDITTPYGYGGAFCWGTPPPDAAGFWQAFDDWARARNVVSEFVRLALFRGMLLDSPGRLEQRQLNVVRTLDLDEQSLWMDVDHKVRKNVNKARRSGLTIEVDPTGRRLDEFLDVYEETMDRRTALDGYYFPRAFFEQLARDLPGQFVYFHAIHAGAVVSTELVLLSALHAYSFLGGTRAAVFDLRPNDLLKYEIMSWTARTGRRAFVLGGGYQPDDGIFRYKSSFAPRGTVPFFTGCRALNEAAVRELVERRRELLGTAGETWSPRPGFFPPYRSP